MQFSRKNLGIPYVVFLLFFVVAPLVVLFFYAFTNGQGQFTLDNLVGFFTDANTLGTLFYSLAVAFVTTAVCLLLAYPIAYILAMSELKTKSVIVMVFVLPMWINFSLRITALKEVLTLLEGNLARYPFLNADLLRAGVIVHDLAKTSEMLSDSMGKVTDYSRDGQLIGHLVRGVANLQTAARNCGIGGEWVVLLEHMILSHHGVAEHGSPQVPKILEAEVLHILDYLDSRVYQMRAAVEKTPVGAFSEKIAILDGRRMYHPYYSDEAE